MTLFDYVNAHPVLALLYLVIAGACLAAFRPVTVRTKTVNNIAPAAVEWEQEEEASEGEEDPAAGDAEADPTGEARETAGIRSMLSCGGRVTGVVADIAESIADTFREEGWRVRVEPAPPGPLDGIGAPTAPRARLTFVWVGEGAAT